MSPNVDAVYAHWGVYAGPPLHGIYKAIERNSNCFWNGASSLAMCQNRGPPKMVGIVLGVPLKPT